MVVTYNSQLRRPYYPGHGSSYLDIIDEQDEDIDPAELRRFAKMDDIDAPSKSKSTSDLDQMAAAKEESLKQRPHDTKTNGGTRTSYGDGEAQDYLSVQSGSYDGLATPSTPGLSRTGSSADIFGNFESFGQNDFPPVDRLTMFDILENLALPQRLEKMQSAVHNQAEKVRRQRAKLANRALSSKNTVVEEWRKRVKVQPEEQLDKYRQRMKVSVDRLSTRWNDAKTVTLKEKVSFVVAVLNIFISAYMIGAFPEYFHWWYTVQLAYVMHTRTSSVSWKPLTATKLLHAHPLVQLPQNRLPLLPRRPLLLRQPPPCPGHLVLPAVQTPVHQHLLPRLRQQCYSDSHVEE